MKYRSEIDGLRTLAVLPVIAFHFGVPFFSGGFVGVDIFFVISGYLITSLIAPEIEQGRFSIVQFYERRIRRIFPALFTVVAVCAPVALYLFLPTDLRQFSQSIIATTLFSSNLLFWHEIGYFDTAAHSKPLLHTWSLAVEEQFYILFPLLLAAFARLAPHRTKIILWTIFFLSLAASVFTVYRNPTSAFYLPQFRAWELMSGGILALTTLPVFSSAIAETVTAVGIALVLYAVFTFSDGTIFPGLSALFPVIGTVLIIAGGKESRLAAGILRLRPIVHIGRLSYSLYLWHWPLLIFTAYYLVRPLSGWEVVALMTATIVLSQMSYQWIEQPVRRGGWKRPAIFGTAAATMAVMIIVGLAGYVSKGLPQRLPAELRLSGEAAYNVGSCLVTANDENAWNEKNCTFKGKPDGRHILLWGDSFSAHYYPGLRSYQGKLGYTFIQAGFAGGEGRCTPLLEPLAELPQGRIHCLRFHRKILEYAKATHPNLVILASRWDMVGNQEVIRKYLAPILRQLHEKNIPVLLVGEAPVYPFIVPQKVWMDAKAGRPNKEAITSNDFASTMTLAALAHENGASLFLPQSVLCHDRVCRYSNQGQLLVWDYGHLSEYGSTYLVGAMLPKIEELLQRPAPAKGAKP